MVKLNDLVEAANEVKDESSDLSATIRIKTNYSDTEEKRIAKLASNVREQEKEQFLALIGRMSESDALRLLALKFIKEGVPLTKSDLS